MADKYSKKKRSEIKRANKSRGNVSTEIAFARLLRLHSVKGWRRNSKIYGKPDFVFPKFRIAMFIDGCFWHGHKCKRIPTTNRAFWREKIRRNQAHDKLVNKVLRSDKWRVMRVWECELKKFNFTRIGPFD